MQCQAEIIFGAPKLVRNDFDAGQREVRRSHVWSNAPHHVARFAPMLDTTRDRQPLTDRASAIGDPRSGKLFKAFAPSSAVAAEHTNPQNIEIEVSDMKLLNHWTLSAETGAGTLKKELKMTKNDQKMAGLIDRMMKILDKHTGRLDKLEEVANAQQQVLHQMRTALEAHHNSLAALAGLASETRTAAPGDVN